MGTEKQALMSFSTTRVRYRPGRIALRILLLIDLSTVAGALIRRRRLAFLPLIRWPAPAFLCATLPVAVILTRLAKPLCVFCLGILMTFESTWTHIAING